MGRRLHTQPAAPLPLRDGVGASRVELPSAGLHAWPTLADFFAWRFPAVPRADWAARMERGDVIDAQGRPAPPGAPCRPQARYYYYRSLPPEEPVPFAERVVYQDERIVVADKPHFLPVAPAGRYLQQTLLVRLKRRLGIATLAPVHRIDRETAGLVLFTVQPAQRGLYQALFRDRAAAKQYEAIAPWHAGLARPQVLRHRIVPAAHFMQMRQAAPEEGPHNAETRIEMLEAHGALARYRLMPATGQRHQLRVQMAALGAPILHDRIYPVLQPEGPPDYAHPLQLLARGLAFTDPVTGAALAFESGLRLAWPA